MKLNATSQTKTTIHTIILVEGALEAETTLRTKSQSFQTIFTPATTLTKN